MKTIYITLLTALFFTGNAQFTMLSVWHAPDSTSTHTTRSYDSTTAIPKALGANMTWDFTNMMRGTSTSAEAFGPASTGTDVALYPNATVVGKMGSTTSYYSTAPAAWELLGAGTDKLTDPMTMMKWPVNFNSTWTDSYAGNTPFGPATGTIIGTCTGHGTVILPGGAKYLNCMQIHTMDRVNFGGTSPFTIVNETYYYYSQLQRFPLMEVQYTWDMDNTDTTMSASIRVNELVAVGINDYNFDADYAIYPNPTSDNFTLKLSNADGSKCDVQIINMTGQVVKEVKLGAETTVEKTVFIGDLSSGIYMVKTSLGDKTSTRRLVVK